MTSPPVSPPSRTATAQQASFLVKIWPWVIKVQLINRLAPMTSFILPYFGVLTFFFLLLESFTYIGSIKKFVLFDSQVFLAIFIGLYLLNLLFHLTQTKKERFQLIQTFISLNYLIFPVTIITYYIFVVMEKTYYPNYVYSTYHVQPLVFRNFAAANLFVVASDVLFKKRNLQTFNVGFKKYFLNTVLGLPSVRQITSGRAFLDIVTSVILLGWFLVVMSQNVIGVSELIVSNFIFITKHPFASREEKMFKTWGDFYVLMKLTAAATPETATILIPPAQNHWLTSGNSVLVRYFLFPRRVINLKETDSLDTLYQYPDQDFDYVLLSKGEWVDKTVTYTWPKTRLPVSEITYFDLEKQASRTEPQAWYEPTWHDDKAVWGVIKMRASQP